MLLDARQKLLQDGPEGKCSVCLQDYEIARGWKATFRSSQVLGNLRFGVTLSCSFPLTCPWLTTLQEGARSWFVSNSWSKRGNPNYFQKKPVRCSGGQSHIAWVRGRANLLFCTDVHSGLHSQVWKLLAGNTGWGFLNRTDPLGSFLQKCEIQQVMTGKSNFLFRKCGCSFCFHPKLTRTSF